jgi:hypothetical protein
MLGWPWERVNLQSTDRGAGDTSEEGAENATFAKTMAKCLAEFE